MVRHSNSKVLLFHQPPSVTPNQLIHLLQLLLPLPPQEQPLFKCAHGPKHPYPLLIRLIRHRVLRQADSLGVLGRAEEEQRQADRGKKRDEGRQGVDPVGGHAREVSSSCRCAYDDRIGTLSGSVGFPGEGGTVLDLREGVVRKAGCGGRQERDERDDPLYHRG